MIIIHAADIHLDSPLVGLKARAEDRADEFIQATRQALVQLVNYVIDEDAALLLNAGDLYDGDWKDFSTGIFFAKEMRRLETAGIPVGVIRGNHDAENNMTRALTLPPNVKVFDTRKAETWLLDDLGVAVHGRSFPNRSVEDNLVPSYPNPVPGLLNIGLLHTSADGRPGHANYAPCSLGDLTAKGYDYWALGHVHTREVLHEDPWVIFSGNLQGRHVRETGAKGATAITVEDGRIVGVEHVDFDVVRWAASVVDMEGCEDHDEMASRVRSAMAKVIEEADGRRVALRLTLTGSTPFHRHLAGDMGRLRAECESAAESTGEIWLEKVKLKTSEPSQGSGADADAISELLAVVDEVRSNPEELKELRATIDDALGKVPDEVRRSSDLRHLDDEMMNAILEDAKTILRHRLLDPGGGT